MTEPDLPDSARRLFDAARRERPRADLEERIRASLARPARPPPLYVVALPFVVIASAAAGAFLLFKGNSFTGRHVALHADQVATSSEADPRLFELEQHGRETPSVSGATSSRAPAESSSDAPVSSSATITKKPKPEPFTLQRELELLGQARAALEAHDPDAALLLLERLAAASKAAGVPGQLQAEARVLRLEALSRAGQDERASAEASDFVRRYPTSPLVDSARRLIRGTPSEAPQATSQP